MTTIIFAHNAFAGHETPEGHPERVDRYSAVVAALGSGDLAALERREPPRAARSALERAHPSAYIDRVEAATPAQGLAALDPDTFLSPGSLDAALRGAGGAIAAVDAVAAGDATNAFVAARPPGHHAETARAMGFCLFNNAAIAARHARAAHGFSRIAVVDFDVHHGNGTEAIFWDDEQGFFASSHEFPQYPGTGRDTDRGAHGNIVNAPLPTGAEGGVFRRAWGETLLPALADFEPEFVVVSAGFDGHRADPLGGLLLVEDDFAWITREIMAVAADKAGGRVVSVLEGGYDLKALGSSAAAHVSALAGIRQAAPGLS
ncbi:MAG: histone deacetylase family protein [Alphaproteobacteria bacterium]|nr:histone deacetylase family protein [Alphaproteobacteria bacterium]